LKLTQILLAVTKPVNPQLLLKVLEAVFYQLLKLPAVFDIGGALAMSIFGQ
jgi:hypothetical protein